jgi:hypothetical protein
MAGVTRNGSCETPFRVIDAIADQDRRPCLSAQQALHRAFRQYRPDRGAGWSTSCADRCRFEREIDPGKVRCLAEIAAFPEGGNRCIAPHCALRALYYFRVA